jgi:hypothetical protein
MMEGTIGGAGHDLVCTHCGAVAASRNKLFKHLKECRPDGDDARPRLQLNGPPLATIEDFQSRMAGVDKYVYVTGGRHRGKTLGSVERFSLSRCTWEVCPRLIENRYVLLFMFVKSKQSPHRCYLLQRQPWCSRD